MTDSTTGPNTRLDDKLFESISEKLNVYDVVVFSSFILLIVSICRIYFSGGGHDVLNPPKVYVNRVNRYNTAAFSCKVKFSIVFIWP